MKAAETEVLKPCRWMTGWIHRLVEGSLRGPLKWFVTAHVDRCAHCSPAFRALLALREGLAQMGGEEGTLSEDRWKKIQEACSEATKLPADDQSL